MKRKANLIFNLPRIRFEKTLLYIICLLTLVSCSGKNSSITGVGFISGVVIDSHSKKPVIDATISVSDSISVNSSSDGTFNIEHPSGTFSLTVTATGYLSKTYAEIVVNKNQKTNLQVHIDPEDSDSDGYYDLIDNCPLIPNANQQDVDNDGFGDLCDAFENNPSEWLDTDSDGLGDNIDTDDDNDGMTDNWEQQYGLDKRKDDALEDLDNDGLSNIFEYEKNYNPLQFTNLPPNKPKLLFPHDASNSISLKPQFTTNHFSDPNTKDNHQYSKWQVYSFQDNNLIIDEISNFFLTAYMSELILKPDTLYYWRVKFFDQHGAESEWSESNTYTTLIDTDNDGMPDNWEQQHHLNPLKNDASDDLDNDDISNLYEYYLNTDPTDSNPVNGTIVGIMRGTITDKVNGNPLKTKIISSARVTANSLDDGSYVLPHIAGDHTFVISQDGYHPINRKVSIKEGNISELSFELTPIIGLNKDDDSGVGCFIYSIARKGMF